MRPPRVIAIAGVLLLILSGPVMAAADPLRPKQFGLDRVQADRAHARALGAGVVIAIVDTGVDLLHEDLRNQLVAGKDYVDNDDIPQDRNGHGTHVAGIAAAESGNGLGVEGVAPAAKILPLRVLDEAGNGSEADVASAIHYAILRAIALRMKLVINMSLTDLKVQGAVSSHEIRNAIRDAWAAGAVVVAAAGNEALPFSDYPAEGPNVISVGATDANDRRASFSNRGANVMAPGEKVVSTFWDPATPDDHAVYASGAGTSMAAPFVSGVAALLMSTGLNNAQTVDRILRTADDLGTAGPDPEFGFGRVNAAKALGLDGEVAPVAATTGLPSAQQGKFDPVGAASGAALPTPVSTPARESRTVPIAMAIAALVVAMATRRLGAQPPALVPPTAAPWEFDPFE